MKFSGINKKITTLLLCTLFPALLIGQGGAFLSKELSVSYSNMPLKQVLADLKKQANLKFSYNPRAIPIKEKINYTANNKTVENVLIDIFSSLDISFTLVEGYLVLKRNEVPKESQKTTDKPKSFTISGIISDKNSKESLIGAVFYVKGLGKGTLSNKYGFFSLTLPEGNYTFESSYLGYGIATKTLLLKSNQKWNIELSPATSLMEEVVINSADKEEIVFSTPGGQHAVPSVEVSRKTAALGETDVLRTLGQLPGVSFQNEGSSYFYVRGGNRDQNLILLDEAIIFNPSHLLGLFSTIIPDAIKHTEVFKGDFPVQYGGKLSSVVDVRTRDGNMEKFSGSASTGLVASRISLEGPIKKERSSYFVSYRRSHIGAFLKPGNPNLETLFFRDFTTKLNLKIGKKDRLFLSIYSGLDKYIDASTPGKEGPEWGNNSFTLRWNHIFNNKLFSNTTLTSSKFDYLLYTNYTKGTNWNSHISSNKLKSEFTYFATGNVKYKFGLELGGYFFNPGVYSEELEAQHSVSKVNSSEVISYLGYEWEISEWLLLNLGLRLSNWANIGEAFVVNFNENYEATGFTNYKKGETYYNSFNIEPRTSLSLKTGTTSSVKLSYNRTLQHINLINNSLSPFNTLEVWMPSGPNIKPQKADIFNCGYYTSFPDWGIDFKTDIYYKQLYNQIGYNYHAEMLLNRDIEGELRQGDGFSYGFELYAKKPIGKVSVQISYSFTRAKQQIYGLNGNREFFARQDKPVDFSLALDYLIKPRWGINMGINIGSGQRYTTPTGFYLYRGVQVPNYTEQYNDRLPTYKRVDIGTHVNLSKKPKRVQHSLSFNLYNFFASENPFAVSFNKVEKMPGQYVVPANTFIQQKKVATYHYLYSIVPSISYKLQF